MVANIVILTNMVLLEKGGDSNAKDNSGITVLMRATGSRNLEAVRYLVDSGADVNAKDENGWTALNHARSGGFTQIVEILKAHGAKE
ncbi:MAG: ankyrin repeat domain-containing protein [Desulfomonilaceae bacterium]